MSGSSSLPPKKILSYAFSLLGMAVFIILFSWMLAILWYVLFLIHIAISILLMGVYILGIVYTLYLAYRIVGYMRSRPVPDVSATTHYIWPTIILVLVAVVPFIVLAAPSWIPYDMHPHLSFTGDPARSMTLSWSSTSSYAGNVSYGTSSTNLNLSIVEPSPARDHVINFTGLAPGTRYFYRITGLGETWSFKTASETANVTRFIAISDIHNMFYPPMTTAITDSDPDFMLAVGDLTDYGASNSDWNKFFSLMAPITTNYSMMTAIGNHDSMFFGEQNYLKYLAMPRASTGSEKYYYFKYNGVHFICLDLEWGLESYDAQQRTWFESTLQNLPSNDWIVVFDHCMHVSSGGFGNATGDVTKLYGTAGNLRDTFHQSFVDHGVDLVISGHDHHFEISEWGGVTYAIVGTANQRLDSGSPTNNSCSVYYEPNHSGFTEIEINGNTCTITGNLYDSDNAPMAPFIHTILA